jgi:hypothetical protein
LVITGGTDALASVKGACGGADRSVLKTMFGNTKIITMAMAVAHIKQRTGVESDSSVDCMSRSSF